MHIGHLPVRRQGGRRFRAASFARLARLLGLWCRQQRHRHTWKAHGVVVGCRRPVRTAAVFVRGRVEGVGVLGSRGLAAGQPAILRLQARGRRIVYRGALLLRGHVHLVGAHHRANLGRGKVVLEGGGGVRRHEVAGVAVCIVKVVGGVAVRGIPGVLKARP